MSFSDNSSKISANSSAQISDQMLVLRANIEKAVDHDLALFKATIDLSQLSAQSLPDFKKLVFNQSFIYLINTIIIINMLLQIILIKRFDKVIINKAAIFSEMDKNEKRLDQLNQTKNNEKNNINQMTDELDSQLDAIIRSTDYLNKCVPSFTRMANKLTQKSKNNCVGGNDNDNGGPKTVDIDDKRTEQLVQSAQQLQRLQHSNRFIKTFAYK